MHLKVERLSLDLDDSADAGYLYLSLFCFLS